jgi:CorA-like Mg2+ transporter protein
MDSISLSTETELMQVSLQSGERRTLFEGEAPFSASEGPFVRIVAPGFQRDAPHLTQALVHDSEVALLLPAYDLDSRDVFPVRIDFYLGAAPVVLIEAADPLPHDLMGYLLESIAVELQGKDLTSGTYLTLAEVIRNVGRWALESRTRRIEQSVRDALGDEEVSVEDYSALRKYPERLANVENGVGRLRENEPEVTSFRPTSPYLAVAGPDLYFKWLEAAGADAREAVARLSGLISSQQVVLTQRQAAETARFQRLVTIVGAAVLVPGLVAGIFGANVRFHGRDSAQAFWAMLLLMLGSGIGSYALLRLHEVDAWNSLFRGKLRSISGKVSDGARLVVLVGAAALALGLGLYMFFAEDQGPRPSKRNTDGSVAFPRKR